MDTKLKLMPPPLPTTRQELLARMKQRQRSIIEHVQDLFFEIYDVPRFRALLEATEDEHSVEGSVNYDRFKAAEMLRDRATKTNNPYLQDQKGHAILKAMLTVMKRGKIGRRQRVKEAQGQLFAPREE